MGAVTFHIIPNLSPYWAGNSLEASITSGPRGYLSSFQNWRIQVERELNWLSASHVALNKKVDSLIPKRLPSTPILLSLLEDCEHRKAQEVHRPESQPKFLLGLAKYRSLNISGSRTWRWNVKHVSCLMETLLLLYTSCCYQARWIQSLLLVDIITVESPRQLCYFQNHMLFFSTTVFIYALLCVLNSHLFFILNWVFDGIL